MKDDRVYLERVWEIALSDVPTLKQQMQAILRELPATQ